MTDNNQTLHTTHYNLGELWGDLTGPVGGREIISAPQEEVSPEKILLEELDLEEISLISGEVELEAPLVSKITEKIYLGNHLDAKNVAQNKRLGINGILCLDGSLEGMTPEELGVDEIYVMDMIDGPGNNPAILNTALSRLKNLLRLDQTVLVHCHAGRSRSPVVVAAYLMEKEHGTKEWALHQIKKVREINPNSALKSLM